MGEALLIGLLDSGFDPEGLVVAEADPERRRMLETTFPAVRVVPSSAWAIADADVAIVAVNCVMARTGVDCIVTCAANHGN